MQQNEELDRQRNEFENKQYMNEERRLRLEKEKLET